MPKNYTVTQIISFLFADSAWKFQLPITPYLRQGSTQRSTPEPESQNPVLHTVPTSEHPSSI